MRQDLTNHVPEEAAVISRVRGDEEGLALRRQRVAVAPLCQELQTHQGVQDGGQPAHRSPGSGGQFPDGLRRLVQQVEQPVVQRRLQDQRRGVAPGESASDAREWERGSVTPGCEKLPAGVSIRFEAAPRSAPRVPVNVAIDSIQFALVKE